MIRGNRFEYYRRNNLQGTFMGYLPLENGDDGSLESDLIWYNEKYKNIMQEEIDCDNCEGTGMVYLSCCGDDIRGNDIDLCPTCGEHQGDEGETCDQCEGTGRMPNVEYFKQLYDGEISAGIYDPKNPTETLEEKMAKARLLK
jgi:RecJ-like exonuclease